MFMVSFRLSAKRVAVGALALGIAVAIGVGLVKMINSEVKTSSEAVVETSEKVKAPKVTAKTPEDRLEFIRSFGWEIEEEPVEMLEVIIPKEFDSVYEEYNSIQKKQDFDLSKFAGKRCRRYSYVITNHPTAEEEIRIHILVYKNKVIGGDVCSTLPDGTIHGFAPEVAIVPTPAPETAA